MRLMTRFVLFWLCAAMTVSAAETAPPPSYDPILAKQTGANDQGMRKYVLVILKTGPNKMPAGAARDDMFKGHFSNMKRLAAEGVLAHAGPLDGVDGWRGLFILAVDTIDEAKKHVATDPVIVQGEMVAEYHTHYGSAALMLMSGLYPKVARQPM